MAIIQGNAKKSTAAGGFYPKTIEGSLRFNDDDTPYLSWTPESAGDQKTWTLSFWCKRANLENGVLFSSGTNSSNFFRIYFSGDGLDLRSTISGVVKGRVKTTAVYRDPSAWYHFVVSLDSTFGTAAERMNVYVNGVLQDLTITTNFANDNHYWNSTQQQNIGVDYTLNSSSIDFFDGYLAEVHFLNGIAATADDFGELKNGVWVAKTYEGDYDSAAQVTAGNLNGFHLTFQDDTAVEAFNTVLYRANNNNGQSVTGMGFQPDLVWIKQRTTSVGHNIEDSVRGAGKFLQSETTAAEDPTGNLVSFDADGFTVGTGNRVDQGTNSYVAWGWKAGGSSNTYNIDDTGYATASAAGLDGGTITPTGASVNTTYGFSIIGYQGTMADDHFEHGLGVAPDMVIIKNRNRSVGTNWIVQHSSVDISKKLTLNANTGADAVGNIFGSTPTAADANYVYLGNVNWVNNNVSGENDHIAYCWTETANYSKFGSYNGNNSTDGPEIDCGFIPSMVILKRTDSAGSWTMYDTTRDTDGTLGIYLYPHLSNNEPADLDTIRITRTTDGDTYDGFKLVRAGTDINGVATTEYIYAAFADTRDAAFWLDQSGNDNDWQPVNLDHNDTVADSPTDNFATLNPLNKAPRHVLSDGNLYVTGSVGNQYNTSLANFSVTSGKYYWEIDIIDGDNNTVWVGVANSDSTSTSGTTLSTALQVAKNWHLYGYNGTMYLNGVSDTTFTGTLTFGTGDHMMIAADADTGKVWVGKNGDWFNSGNPTAGTGEMFTATGDITPIWGSYKVQHKAAINFGQQPFKYDPPS